MNQDLEFGQFAVRFGPVTEEQLQAALAKWNGDADRSLSDILVENGALSEDECKALQTLLAANKLAQASPAATRDPLEPMSGSANYETVDHASRESAHDPRSKASLDAEHRFDRLELHAEGGLGQVYEAHDRQLNRTVALKEIKGRYADAEDSRERFTKEAEITGRLEHPGIVPVYALGKYADGRPYYAMRFIKGKSLRAAINDYHNNDQLSRQERVLAMRSMLGNLLDVCDAIYYAHRRGIVHRDIKPSNIMLGDYGETLVVDWGLAKNLGRREDTTASLLPTEETLMPTSGSSVTETMVGKAIGSPAFMSPEQARGEHDTVEFGSDIYGLGATLFAVLTGKAPVQGASSNEILSKVRKGDLINPRRIATSTPKALDAICMKAMALEPADRYETVRDFKRDLERYLVDEPIDARRESVLEKTSRAVRRHRWLLPVIVVGLLAVSLLQFTDRRNQTRLATMAQAKEREMEEAFDFVGVALGAIQPFEESDVNVQRLQRHAELIAADDAPDMLKARVYDVIVEQLRRFERPGPPVHWAEEALRISRDNLGPGARATLVRQKRLAEVLYREGDYERGVSLLTDIQTICEETGLQDGFYYSVLNDLAVYYQGVGDVTNAIRLLQKVVAYREQFSDVDVTSPLVPTANLANLLRQSGRFDEAAEMFEKVAAVLANPDVGSPSQRVQLLMGQYLVAYQQGNYDFALAGMQRLFDENVSLLQEDHTVLIWVREEIAVVKQALQRFDEAIADYKKAINLRRQIGDESSRSLWQSQLRLGSILLTVGKLEEAIEETGPWLEKFITATDFQHDYCHFGSRTMAFALLQLERYDEAAQVIQAWESAEDSPKPDRNFSRAIAAGELALAQENLGLVTQYVKQAQTVLAATDNLNPSDQAGIHSLNGAYHLAKGQFDLAEAELTKAKEQLEEAGNSLQSYQTNWPKAVEQRLVKLEQLR